MNFTTMRFETIEQVGIVTFSVPDRLNAIDEARLTDLETLLSHLETDGETRALIVTGEGRAFCVGLDLDLLDRAFGDIPFFVSIANRLSKIIERIEALPIPTIAAVNGFARAGGFEMCLGMDFMIIADTARIGDAHTDAGVVPACVTLRLRRRVGQQRAKDLIFSARWLEGPEAVEWGLALVCVPAAALRTASLAFAHRFTDKPRATIAAMKHIFVEGEGLDVAAGTELELRSFADYMTNEPYGREGYRAFREKRAPNWRKAS
jgi:enoyl-CoA hydratase/carnithine racemase